MAILEKEASIKVLYDLGLSESEVQLYLIMLEHGALTVREMVKLSHAKRPTAYYALGQLMDRGLVHRVGGTGVERFQAETPDKLLTLLELKRREVDGLEAKVALLIPHLKKEKIPHEGMPAVSFYEGEKAMKRVIMETLYCRDLHIDSLAPHNNFFWQVDQPFASHYVDERVTRKITTRNLWERPLEPAILLKSYAGLSKVRVLPKEMHGHFRTTIFLYDDSVMYISSRKSGYVLLVRSKEHHELMVAMYNALWEKSVPVTIGK